MLWSQDILTVNPECRATVHHVGPAKRKVVLADDFYLHPEQVSELSLNLFYTNSGSLVGSYPGSRALVTLDTYPLLAALSDLWGEALHPYHADYHPMVFSAILNRDMELSPWQRQPHIDQGVTAMVYLNPEDYCSGGTGLYTHRPTGLDRIPIELDRRLIELGAKHGFSANALCSRESYAEFINQAIFHPDYATKDNSFINRGNEFWELEFLIEMKPNRLVIFDGRMPHSQFIDHGQFQDYFRINQILYFQGHD